MKIEIDVEEFAEEIKGLSGKDGAFNGIGQTDHKDDTTSRAGITSGSRPPKKP